MRLAGKLKLGFYPAQESIVAGVLARLTTPAPDLFGEAPALTLLDPCCGQGAALGQLTAGLPGARSCGIELDAARCRTARTALPAAQVIQGSYEETRIPEGAFSLLWLNPPYDSELGGGRRQEASFLANLHRSLVPDGILVLLIPGKILGAVASTLIDSFSDITLFHGDPRWRQVVVIGRYRRGDWQEQSDTYPRLQRISHQFNSGQPLDHIKLPLCAVTGAGTESFPMGPDSQPSGWEKTAWLVPAADPEAARLAPRRLNPDLVETALLGSTALRMLAPALVKTSRLFSFQPVTPLRQAHLANLLMLGGINGESGTGDEAHVIYGGVQKDEHIDIECDGDREIERRRPIPKTIISIAELATGNVYDL